MKTRSALLLAWSGLALASGAAMLVMAQSTGLPSLLRDPLEHFVAPGTAVWWLVLGGPFRVSPSTAGGIAFAAAANGSLWLLPAAPVIAVVNRLRARRH